MRTAARSLVFVVALGCSASEAPRVQLPVIVDGSALAPATTDLGWTITFERAAVALADLQFTTAGELHADRTASSSQQVLGWLDRAILPRAWAHPGHEQGGEIIGELVGDWVIDFVADDGRELGLATLIVGEYTALNFLFERADAGELDGHTALLRGTASKDGVDVAFTILIDSPADRELVGVLFEASIEASTASNIALRWLAVDPIEGDHLFDGIDFTALDLADGAADGVVEIGDPEANPGDQAAELDETYYEIRRDFQTHDLWAAVLVDP